MTRTEDYYNGFYMKDICRHIEAFEKAKILVVGDVMLDAYIEGPSHRLSPEAPVPVISVQDPMREYPGGAANVASALSCLGVGRVSVWGRVGEDACGQSLSDMLHSRGIVYYLYKGGCTTTKTRILCNGQQICRLDHESIYSSPKDELAKSLLTQEADTCDVIIISDYAKGVLDEETFKILSKYKKKIILDPKPVNGDMYKKYLKGIRYITPNTHEAYELYPASSTLDSARGIGRNLACGVVVTQGQMGCLLVEREYFKGFPGEAVEVSNVIGAGDVFIAAFSAVLAVSRSQEAACILANMAAAESVRHPYTHNVSGTTLMAVALNE